MTTNYMKSSYERNGLKGNRVIQKPQTVATPGLTVAGLESVCSSVAELARSAPKPPTRIKLCHGPTTVEIQWPDTPAAPATGTGGAPPEAEPDPGTAAAAPDDGLSYLCAPMVGTFYRASEPGAAPLVSVGDRVEVGQAVGVFEVMKMLSTLKAEVAGRVVEILVADAQPVEFQQRLIAVEPLSSGKDR